MDYRKKWEKNWAEVKYCSDQCRRTQPRVDFEHKILELCTERGPHKTICPSEILPLEKRGNKPFMERVREAARRLADRGSIEILQQNKVVDPTSFKGPIRLRLKRVP